MAVIDKQLTDLTEEYMISYMMSVMEERAIADVRDGLKPVQRYNVWSSLEKGFIPSKARVKCAQVVGNVIADYSPHGDASAYAALCRLAQEFSVNIPLIDFHGNKGTINGDSPAAYRYCLTKDAILTLSDGKMIYINDIVKNSTNSSTTNIDLNCMDLNGKEVHASKFFNSGKHPIYKLTTEFKSEISGTSNHPLMVLVYENNKIVMKWKTLSEINTGDILLKPKMNIYQPMPISDKEKQLALFYGGFVSEGGFSKNQKYYRITFNNSDTEYYNLVLNGYKTYLNENNFELNIRENHNASGTNKRISEFCTENKALYNLLKNEVGGNATEKCIPKFIMDSNMEIQKWFLKALFEGDGGIAINNDKRRNTKYGCIFYLSYSKKLIKELRIMLNNFNIFSTINKDRNGFKISIRAFDDIKRFYNIIGFLSDRKNNILREYIDYKEDYRKNHSKQTERRIPFISNYLKDNGSKKPSINNFMHDFRTSTFSDFVDNKEKLKNYLTDDKYYELVNIVNTLNNYNFEKVSSIERLNEEDVVYSIRVDSDDHSFIADGFINHNTECRLSKYAMDNCKDINKDAVDFVPNYSNLKTEPTVLPATVPNLLVNGSLGIATGFIQSIPPHNINDVCDMTIKLIKEPNTSVDYVAKHLRPDFPTGGIICNNAELTEAYKTGKGVIKVRCHAEIHEKKNGSSVIRLTDLPYLVTIGPRITPGATNNLNSGLINSIVEKIKDGTIEGITDIRDHSGKDICIEIYVKKGFDPNVILNNLYKNTAMTSSYKMQLVCLNNKHFDRYDIKRIFTEFIDFRRNTIRRTIVYDINRLKERIHILEGLIIALEDIDNVIKIIRSSKDEATAKIKLKKAYKNMTTVQIDYIVDMKLGKLTSLGLDNIKEEKKEKVIKCNELIESLKIENIDNKIVEDLLKYKKDYGYPRKTELSNINTNITEEDIIEKEDCVLILTKNGYVKRLPSDKFKTQKRNTQGNNISDDVRDIFATNTKDHLLCFTNMGRVFDIKVFKISECSVKSKGMKLPLNLKPNENVVKFLCLSDEQIEDKNSYLMFVTEKGLGKKTALEEFKNINSAGIIAIDLKNDDKIVFVGFINSNKDVQDIIIATAKGMTVRYDHEEFKPIGRTTQGMAVMKLADDDYIASACIIENLDDKIFFITKNGLGKTTLVIDMVKKKDCNTKKMVDINDGFPRLKRSSNIKGRIGIALKNDELVEIVPIHKSDKIKDIIITTTSKVLTISTEDFLEPQKRTTYGKKLINMKDENDNILSVTLR